MNIERAKELLSGKMEDSGEELAKELNEALVMLESDPALQDWMEQQEQMDPIFKEAITDAPVPEGLEGKLLQTVGAAKVGSLPAGKWMRWGMAIAAVLVLGIGSLFVIPKGEKVIQGIQGTIAKTTPDSFDHFRDGMAYFIRNVYFKLDHTTQDIDSIENWLIDHQAPVYEFLPSELLALDPIGCKQFQWQGQNVSLVCFHTRDGKIVHMFILEKDSVEERRYQDITTIAASHDLETGGWTTDSKVYVLVGSDPEVDIEFALG